MLKSNVSAVGDLNEVLSIRAQEFAETIFPHPVHTNLNEVLSIRAQECGLRVHVVARLNKTSMKS